MAVITTLDILIIVSTIIIALVGAYLVVILHRVAHMTSVANRFATTIEKFQDLFSIIDKIPTAIIHRIMDTLYSRKK